MKRLLIGLIRFYQRYVSILTPPVCRFEPTCSNYMLEAVQVHGLARGGFMGSMRILRCHPFHPGGYDPVPLPAGHDGCGHAHHHHLGDGTDPADAPKKA